MLSALNFSSFFIVISKVNWPQTLNWIAKSKLFKNLPFISVPLPYFKGKKERERGSKFLNSHLHFCFKEVKRFS